VGLPASGALIAEVGFYSAMTLLMGRFGGRDLAAHGIAMNALSLAFMVPLGLASAVAIRLAQSRGREDAKGAWRAASAGAELLQAVQLVTGIAFFGFPTAWVRPYTGDPALVAAAGPYLRMAGILFFFDGTQVLLMQALRGLRDTRVPFLITTAAYWGLGVPAGYQMAFAWSWGAKGLWYGMILALAAVTPLLFCRLRRNLSG
jgi:MATE family multidrug resistance protein